ncbi:hypothetical protein MMC26_002441 [Xylographa opegraphella]|nr:hypothetical protein [Xylographa opegraphella]
MHALIHRRIVVPAVLVVILTIIFISSLPSLNDFHFGRLQATNGVSAKAAAAAAESVEQSADMVYPLFDYTYDKIFKLSAEKQVSKDPCIDVALPNGGNVAKPGDGIRVLITGGAGFIGSNLVDRLLQLGYKVRIFDNLYTGFLRNVPIDHENVEFFLGDILDKDAISAALEGIDFVYHLAAMSKVVPSLKSPAMARFCTESNALGSWNVLDAVREQGGVQKVIYAASSTYYGNKPAPHREDMAPDFLTPYAASKYEGELQMQMFDRLFGVPTISTRFFMVYGPRQPSTGAYAIVTGVFAKQASEGKPLTIEGDGSHYRDFIHVHDIVEGLILSQQNPDLRGDVVNLGSGSAFSVQDVANLVSSSQVHVEPRANDLEGTLANTCKMKRSLGYKAKKDFKVEMAFMARETMEGNVFMQPWLTPIHALSAPHLLAPGSPMFRWPGQTSDLDALLLALKHVEEKALREGESVSRRVSLIMFVLTSNETEQASDLLLNTVFSLVRFGGVRSYIVAAKDEEALSICVALNLPCYDARNQSQPALVSSLISSSYDVHVVKLGNAYISNVESTLAAFISENANADVVGAKPYGDAFIRSNDRTKAAFTLWARSAASPAQYEDGGEILFDIDNWPALDLTKASFTVDRHCGSSWLDTATITQTVTSQTASPTLLEPRPAGRRLRRRPFKVVLAVIVTTIVIVALILGLYFGLHNRSSSIPSSPESPASPSSAPSAAPSSSPIPSGSSNPPATLLASAPASSFPPIQESFVSFAVEFYFFPDFSGNLASPNTFSDNLLNNIGNISGTKPYIRVGGNTQDLAIYDAALPVATQATYINGHPGDISIGPSFFEGYSSFPGSKFIHGLNLKNATNSAIGWKSLADETSVACKALDGKLVWWEYGNEPDVYPRSPSTWNAATYVDDWHNGTAAIQQQLSSSCPDMSSGSHYGFVGPSLLGTSGLPPVQLFKSGLNDNGEVKQYTMHHYMGSATDSATLQSSLMNHTAVTTKLASIVTEISNLNNPSLINPTNAAQNSIPFTLDEANSLLNGAPAGLDILSVFGSALWTVDYMLYCASIGLSRVHMQQGTGFLYNSWQPVAVPAKNMDIATSPPYYGNVAVAAMLGDLTKAIPQIFNVPLPGMGDYASAYAAYVDGTSLVRIAVVDLRAYNASSGVPRPSSTYTFVLPSALAIPDGREVRVQRLLAAGSDVRTGITWDGWSYAYELDGGRPVCMANVTVGETVVVGGGRVAVDLVRSSVAVLSFS